MFCHRQHRPPNLPCRHHQIRQSPSQHRQHRPTNRIKNPINLRLRLDPIHRLNQPRPKHISLQRQPHQRILSPSLHPRPHDPTLLRAVCPRARNIGERHPRIDPAQRLRRRQRKPIRDPLVISFLHPARRHSETEEARTEPSQLPFNPCIARQIPMHNFSQLRIAHPRRRPPHGHRQLHIRVPQALPQHTLSHHPRRPKQKHPHRVPILTLPNLVPSIIPT